MYFLAIEITKRKLVAEQYWANLSGLPGIQVCKPTANVKSNYAYLPVVFEDEFGAKRDEVFDALAQKEIGTRKYFYPLISDFECYRDQFNSDRTPIAQYVAAHVLTLPMYADLALEDVDKICEIVIECKK